MALAMLLLPLTMLIVTAHCDGKKKPPPTNDRNEGAPPLGTISIIGSPSSSRASSPSPTDASASSSLEAPLSADAMARPSAFDCSSSAMNGEPRVGKTVGHTSVVFKLELTSGDKFAFKPHAKKVKDRYRGEIAAYRFAEALDIHNVLPACFRVFAAQSVLSAVASSDAGASLFTDEVIVEDGKTKGALIPWIDSLGFWAVEKEPLRTETRSWLTATKTIPEGKADLARQLSTMIVFDAMTGNWDRYSGGNVGLDKTGILLLYIDNDAAFMEAPPNEQLAKNKQLLDATDRFSKRFIAKVRALDEDKIAAALGEEAAGKPLVSRAVITAIAKRAKEVIAIVDAKIAKRGEAETLYFP